MWSCERSFYERSYHRLNFFEGCSWFKLNNLGHALRMAFKVYTSVAKRVEDKSQKVLGANSYVCRNYRAKNWRKGTFCSSIQNRFKIVFDLKGKIKRNLGSSIIENYRHNSCSSSLA